MIDDKTLDECEKTAKRIFEVIPCDGTLDGWGVMILLEESTDSLYGPAYTREEFIEQFKSQNKAMIKTIQALRQEREDVALASRMINALETMFENYPEPSDRYADAVRCISRDWWEARAALEKVKE